MSNGNASEANGKAASDVGAERVARVYAEALLKAAQEANQTPEVLEEFNSLVHDVFPADPQLVGLLVSGVVGREHKAEMLRAAFAGRASPIFLNFLLVLNEHDRLNLLRPVLAAYKKLFDERSGRMLVEVRSAAPLSEHQLDRLRQELRESFRREPVLATRVDPELLGGLVVQVGDWLYDASVRTRLASLRHQLIESSSHEIQSGRDRFSDLESN